MTTIITRSGKRVDLIRPKSETICIEDIAHALAHENRYSGHTPRPISVAEHSIMVSDAVQRWLKFKPDNTDHSNLCLAALLHDAPEAYIKDLPKPLKVALQSYVYEMCELMFARVIEDAVGVLYLGSMLNIKQFDTCARVIEQRVCWGIEPPEPNPLERWFREPEFMAPQVARQGFLNRFYHLTGKTRP